MRNDIAGSGSIVVLDDEIENDYQSLKGSACYDPACYGFVNENDCQIYDFPIGNYLVLNFFVLAV